MRVVKATTLYYKDGRSDKVYHAELRQEGKWSTVHIAYGRRGSTLQTQAKTPAPVAPLIAEDIFNKVVAEKRSKGYVEGEATPGYEPPRAETVGLAVQLLNAVDEREALRKLRDSTWWLQEKKDGKRMVLANVPGVFPVASNRRGKVCGMPSAVQQAVAQLPACVIDGECIGDVYWAFDCLHADGMDLLERPYSTRYEALRLLLLMRNQSDAIRIVDAHRTNDEKAVAFERLRTEGCEGVVLKNSTAKYVSGRPASGGAQLKYKFWETATVIATPNSDRSSFDMAVLDGETRVPVGSCTVPPNKQMPAADDFCEVRYLYAYREGSIYQPTFLCNRTDELEIADVTQHKDLKFKSET